jgi:hypothetical protein
MLRRWTLTALCVGTICLSVGGARVATAAPSLAERLSFLTGGGAAKPKPIRDENVQPAAAAANRPRAAKDAAMAGTTRRSTGGGGGLFGGRLPLLARAG